MKKTTGKVVSLVLALALVVTSFSATFAFAATKTESGTATLADGTETVYLSNGGATGQQSIELGTDWLMSADVALTTYDHQTPTDITIAQVAHSSGDSLVKITKDSVSGKYTLSLKAPSTAKGTEVLSLLVTGNYFRDPDTYTVRGTVALTVKVVPKGTVYLTDTANVPSVGGTPKAVANFLKSDITDATAKAVSVYVVKPATGSALATYGTAATSKVNATTEDYNLVTTGNMNATLKLTSAASVGNNLRISAFATTATPGTYSTTAAAVANFKVENTISGAFTTIHKGDGSSSASSKSKTYAYLLGATTGTDVTGANVVTSANVTVADGKIANLTVTGTATINGGTVGDIVATDNVTVADGTVASIKATGKTVTISGGTIGTVKDAATVDIYGGKVGDVTATTVSAAPAADDTPVTVGKVSAKDLTVDATVASATTGAFTATAQSGEVALLGKASVGAIDFNYYEDTLNLTNFTGSVAAPAKATLSSITSSVAETNATVTGNVNVTSIDLSDGTVKFTDSVKVKTVSGAGALAINAGKLQVTEAINGAVTLKLIDPATVKAGTVVYQAASDISDVDSFTTYGYTLKEVTGTTTDTFIIDKVQFAGIVIDKPSTKVVVNDSATFTASAYPAGTTLPAGDTIKWSFDGADDFFTTIVNGNSITIKSIKYDGTFTSLNKGVLTASVIDEYGIDVSDYGTASIDVTSIAKPEYVSDTNNNFSVNSGATYQFKITSATAPVLTLGTAGVFTVAPVSHVAGSNDYFFKITATGKVGSATGVFINGNKLLVATVKAPAFTSDTKGNVTVKGAYTVKITSATVPTFGVGTAGVFSAKFVSKTGNDYLYKISSVGKVGTQAGIYINGVKTFVGIVG